MAPEAAVRFPERLRPGDTVALVAPAGPVSAERVEGAVALLSARGLRVRVREDITARRGYLAGSDRRRAEELRDALADPGVRAVFLARGGYGTQRILAGALPDAGVAPKPVIGFSDNTALLNALRRELGWAVVHGPHPRNERPEELDRVLACLGYWGEPERPFFDGLSLLSPRRTAAVEGEVAGGCLSLVTSSIGTPYALDCAGKILFLEDVGEPAYRLDRMLLHLRASGASEAAAAVVFGCPEEFGPEDQAGEVAELLAEFASAAAVPVLSGLACGHGKKNQPLLLGPRARLEPAAGTLTFLEAAVQ
ncbi:MAG: LD-carboxypeptidase [Deltaproteobacteria bacterium]|nr:LD-carboxypeptidase [Deltaproteobacteria bacterium]